MFPRGLLAALPLLFVAFAKISFSLPPWRLFPVYFRDMPLMHPDVEGPYAARFPQSGLVERKLGEFGEPVFVKPSARTRNSLQSSYEVDLGTSAGSAGGLATVRNINTSVSISNNGRYYFQEFFADVPGVNIAFNSTLNFTLVDPVQGTYQWSQLRFFPLDNLGFGVQEAMVADNPSLSLSNADFTPHNFGFSTEMKVQFFYRGGEIFMFTGDDDVWVFIDDKLTACDLGGIHQSASCILVMDNLGLVKDSTYRMSIFHIERHSHASTFSVTTSVKPENLAPRVSDSQQTVMGDVTSILYLYAVDIDEDSLRFHIVKPPKHGILTPTNEPKAFTYIPEQGYVGTDVFSYVANDGFNNSTQANVNLQVLTADGKTKLIIKDSNFEILVGESKRIEVKAQDQDGSAVLCDNMKVIFTQQPVCGEVYYKDCTIVYTALKGGDELIRFTAVDRDGNVGSVKIEGKISDPKAVSKISGGTLVGIVIGSVLGFSVLGGLLAYFIYHKYMAARFAAAWQSQWADGADKVNPLYVSGKQENENPLFDS